MTRAMTRTTTRATTRVTTSDEENHPTNCPFFCAIAVWTVATSPANAAECRYDQGGPKGIPVTVVYDGGFRDELHSEILDNSIDDPKAIVSFLNLLWGIVKFFWPDWDCGGTINVHLQSGEMTANWDADSTAVAIERGMSACHRKFGPQCYPHYFRYCGSIAKPRTNKPKWVFASAKTPQGAADAAIRDCRKQFGSTCQLTTWEGSSALCNKN